MPHVLPDLEQCLQYLQFLQALQDLAPVHVAALFSNLTYLMLLAGDILSEIKPTESISKYFFMIG